MEIQYSLRPPVGVAGHGHAPYRGGHPWPSPYRGGWLWPRLPMARAAASKHGCLRAWLALAGVGSTRRSCAHGDAPFEDDANPQGRRLRAQRLQELPPEGQRHPSVHRGSDTYHKGGRPWARWPLVARSTSTCTMAVAAVG
ncbi:hypothetical protein B296_00030114 [Ensete ventricosum]|uniref:Uncharacterized protein n=1 Tax=Ensete ventricosum TaxID=4639 RepID=A0A426XYW0_ENSVE|nr:hypothetical protein B296_00030114 [Ensete ventricosum]